MSSAQDMRDMLGLTGDVARPPPLKKQKTTEKRPLEKGMAREVSALMGERAPPISMIQVQPKYKQRPRRAHRAAPWELVPFKNQARDDGLLLHHWQRKQPAKPRPTEPTDGDAALEEEKGTPDLEKEYQFAKYNVQIEAPSYTDELYTAQLQDSDWTKQETDYLVDLVKEFAQKWPVVVDRYDFTPQPTDEQEETAVTQPKQRSMEDLKHRYYTISAKVLAHHTPISSMTGPQYSLYKTLSDFNSAQETSRKKLAEGHLYRSQAEVDEETTLLAELQRIMINQQQLENDRRQIREALDYPIATSNTTGATYSTSTALGQLFQQLLAADRMKKDRRLKNIGEHAGATPTSAQAATTSQGHRDSIGGNSQPRKSSARESLGGNNDSSRALSPHSNARYFVTTHDRLSSGVSFASDKLHKARTAKSTVQTERIAEVLSFVRIPEIIPLPTQRVIDEFDDLMKKVQTLLDMRKLAEKEEGEIKVKMAEKGIKAQKDGVKVEETDERSDAPASDKKDDSQDKGDKSKKRSASVLSTDGQKSSKRPKN
ncbi:hypothetical protein MBLNU459_g6074t1 [Dothideomycetes sp. NU459]